MSERDDIEAKVLALVNTRPRPPCCVCGERIAGKAHVLVEHATGEVRIFCAPCYGVLQDEPEDEPATLH